MVLVVENLCVNADLQEMWVRSLCWEDPLEEGMATHSSTLAWRIPWTEEPHGLVHEVAKWDMTEVTEHACTHIAPRAHHCSQDAELYHEHTIPSEGP